MPFTNVTITLDFDEIWQDCAMGYTTHSCQISSESNLQYVRYYGRIELRRLTGSRRPRIGFRVSSAILKRLIRST